MRTAIILAGGRGLRLGPVSEDVPKPMMRIGGRPILEYIIERVAAIGIRDIRIVVAYKKETIIQYFGDGTRHGVAIEYTDNPQIDVKKKSGLSDAVLLFKGVITEPFMTILGDEVYHHTQHQEMVSQFESDPRYESMIAVHQGKSIEEVKKNYSVKISADGLIEDLEEKPEHPWNNYIGCGTYLFKPSIFSYIEQTAYSPKSGRRELADTMKQMVADGKKIGAYDIGGAYLNINYPEDIARAEAIVKGAE